MGELSPWHWVIVLLVFAALFGSRKLPDAARSLGKSMRIFRAEMRSAQDEPVTPGTPPVIGDATPPAAEPVRDAVPPPPKTA